jgi:phage terminase large subunit-like protein
VVSVDFLNGVEKIVRPEISRWLPTSELLGGSWETAYDKELRTLTLENGSTIEFMSYDQDLDKFAGTSRHWVWFDEEPPKDIHTECLLRLVDTGGDWWITMTPVDGMTWVYDDIYERANPSNADYDANLLVVEVDTTQNPHINAGEIDTLLAGLDANEKKARLHGQFVMRAGLIYPTFNESIHVVNPILPMELNPNQWMHFNMMDHGFSNPTAWLWSAIDREGRMIVYEEYYKQREIVKVHAQNVLAINSRLQIAPTYSVGDPSIRNTDPITGTSVQLEYIEHGIPIILGNNDFKAGTEAVRRRLGGNGSPVGLYITRNCTNLIWEMKRYRFALWANKKMDREKNQKEEAHKKDDHACDALRYGVASRPQVEDFSFPEEVYKRSQHGSVSPYDGRIDHGVTAPARRTATDEYLGEVW